MEEIWKAVVGYEGLYEVSNLGRIKSLARAITINGNIENIKERIRKSIVNRLGYHNIVLHNNGFRKEFIVSRLVSIAFHKNHENKPHVNHINGNPSDNRAENLEWCTRSENLKHAYATGLAIGLKGSANPKSKLSNEDVTIIRRMYDSENIKCSEIAKTFNMSHGHICKIVGNRQWSHI